MPLTAVPIRVALVHDARVVEAGLRLLTAPYSDRVRLLPAGGDPAAAVHRADVVLHGDARPPLFRRVTREAVELVYSARPRPEVVRAAVAHGAAGFACKDWTGLQLATVLLRLVEARDAASADGAGAPYEVIPHPAAPGPGLSPREGELLQLIAHGLSNDEIAAQMTVSVNSVKSYIRSAYRKIGVTRRTQAVLWVLGHDLAATVEGEASLSQA